MQEISLALANLDLTDSAELITTEGSAHFNLEFEIAPETIEQLTIRESIAHEQEMILKVKKPDFLGESRWEFVHETAIEAKILDREWLDRFQQGLHLILPGDALRALVA